MKEVMLITYSDSDTQIDYLSEVGPHSLLAMQ